MRVCLLTRGLASADPSDPLAQLPHRLAERHGAQVVLVPTERTAAAGTAAAGVPVLPPEAVARERFDVAMATSWPTTAHLFAVPATRYAYRVEDLAHLRMGGWNPERLPAALSYDLPVDFLAANPAARTALADLRPDARCLLAPGGLDHRAFGSGPPRAPGAALRILAVAGADGELPEVARDALAAMAEPSETSLLMAAADAGDRAAAYRAADVLLAAAPDADPSGPLLEAMAAGLPGVAPAGPTGAEPVDHGVSGIVAEPDDPRGTARWLDTLARDAALLGELRTGAAARAAAHPSWDDAAAALHAALELLVAEEPPAAASWPGRLMGDAMAGAALWHNDHHRLAAALRQVETSDAYRLGARLQDAWDGHPAVGRVLRPLARRARRRLSGS